MTSWQRKCDEALMACSFAQELQRLATPLPRQMRPKFIYVAPSEFVYPASKGGEVKLSPNLERLATPRVKRTKFSRAAEEAKEHHSPRPGGTIGGHLATLAKPLERLQRAKFSNPEEAKRIRSKKRTSPTAAAPSKPPAH